MPNPQHVPYLTNGVLLVAVGACAALLLGAPVEQVLSVSDNPASRVAVVSFALSLAAVVGLGTSIHLLLHRHRRFERELAEMRQLVEVAQARTAALTATADGLEARVEGALTRLEDEMASERERMRAQARVYLGTVPGAKR